MTVLTGNSKNNTLNGSGSSDTLSGLGGNDKLYGKAGDDTLIGGTGDDTLTGSTGSDTYKFDLGDGEDTIVEQDSAADTAVDKVVFGAGITSDTVTVRALSNGSLVLSIDGTDSSIKILNFFKNDKNQIEEFIFSDGTVWTADDVSALASIGSQYADYLPGSSGNDNINGLGGADKIHGGDGNDYLAGGAGVDQLWGDAGMDTLSGGLGDDLLAGGSGSDTYAFSLGDGEDKIYEVDKNASYDDVNSYTDVIVFGDGILASGVTVRQNSAGTVVLSIDGTDDRITIEDFGSDKGAQVEEVHFADGTVWTATDLATKMMAGSASNDFLRGTTGADTIAGLAGDDRIYGLNGDDDLTGGKGNDRIDGSGGSDTYHFALGDGADIVYDYDRTAYYGSGTDTDTLVFGTGIVAGDLNVTQDSEGGLIIAIEGTDDSVTISQFFNNAGYQIEGVEFSDGTELSAAQLAALAMQGSSSNDYLRGTKNADTITGLAGDDRIYGMNGDDDLTGGTGNDRINGSRGSDTYHFALGDGADTLYDYDSTAYGSGTGTDTDILVFGTGIVAGDLNVTQDSDGSLIIAIEGTDDSVTINEFFSDAAYQIESVEFSDGTALSAAQLAALAMQGSSSNDYLRGTKNADTITGLAGDDRIYGVYGDDDLTGGTGDDHIDGARGSDTYHFALGDGADTLYDYDSTAYYGTGTGTDTDTLVFGTGIVVGDLNVTQGSEGSLIIAIEGTDDSITINQFFSNAAYQIESVEFSDGTALSAAQLAALAMQGSSSNDYLRGTKNADTITGLAGDDRIYGLQGNDVLTGGTGDDTIYGSNGADTYHFALGDGADTMSDYDSTGYYGTITDTDILVFGTGIAAGAVTVRANADGDLIITTAVTSDSILVDHGASDLTNQLEEVHFSNGTVWDSTDLVSLRLAGTAGQDYLWGSGDSEVISGKAAADTIYGQGGADILIGGAGGDRLHGNSGQDTASYIDASAAVTANLANRLLNAGDAKGDQYDSVEDLVGSKFNDKLTGSSVANSIDGGAGKDILTGGKGADHFVFGKSYGNDTISDFEFGSTKHDIIDLSDAVGISNYRDLVRNHMSDAGHNVLITAADGAKLTILNIDQLSSLVQADFLF